MDERQGVEKEDKEGIACWVTRVVPQIVKKGGDKWPLVLGGQYACRMHIVVIEGILC
jgi:hypothetical protein